MPPFKGASTGMRRRADDVTRIDEARCAAHANVGNLKRQLEQRSAGTMTRNAYRDFVEIQFGSVPKRGSFVTICAGRKTLSSGTNVRIVSHSHLPDVIRIV